MDNAMADIQADDMKHGLYDEPKRANLDEALTDWVAFAEEQRTDLEERIAQKLLEVVSQDDLENTYYEMQREWAETLPDDELMQTARDLGIDL
jgi:hypothetical protein